VDHDYVSTQFHPFELVRQMMYAVDQTPADVDQSPSGAVVWSLDDASLKTVRG